MVESQPKANKPELYERLIDRLGMALDAARTSGRLRDELPAELELRGLSGAEIELINAWLDLNGRKSVNSVAPVSVAQESPRSAKVIWLKDKAPDRYFGKARQFRAK